MGLPRGVGRRGSGKVSSSFAARDRTNAGFRRLRAPAKSRRRQAKPRPLRPPQYQVDSDNGPARPRLEQEGSGKLQHQVRVAIDQARFDHLRERPKDPFTAAQDLASGAAVRIVAVAGSGLVVEPVGRATPTIE